MEYVYLIPIAVNPYNGNLENVKCDVRRENDASIIRGYSGCHISITSGFDKLTPVTQRFALLREVANTCYVEAITNTSYTNPELCEKMKLAKDQVIISNVIDRMITLYGSHYTVNAIDELYKASVLLYTQLQRYKEAIRMHTYGDPYDVRVIRELAYNDNGAKFTLEDVDVIFICEGGKFDITTIRYQRF